MDLRRRVAQREEQPVRLLEVLALARRAEEEEPGLDALRVAEARLVLGERLLGRLDLAARHRREMDRAEHERPGEPERAAEVVGLGERGASVVGAAREHVDAAERE